MVAALGSGKPQRPGRRFVGDCPRLPVRAVPRIGGTVELQWPGVARAVLTRPSPTLAVIETGSTSTEIALLEMGDAIPKGAPAWRADANDLRALRGRPRRVTLASRSRMGVQGF